MDSPTWATRQWRKARLWWAGRNWRAFLFGGPALVAGLGTLLLAVTCLTTSPREIQARYAAEGKSALQGKDYRRALTCYERLAPTAPDQPEVLYRLAEAADALGDSGRAVGLMHGLAPGDRRGYAPAHFWWARQMLAMPPTPQTLATAEVHLVRALDGELEDRDAAHGLLGQLYLNQGRLDDAEFHLGKAVTTRPPFRMALARLFARRQNPGRARQEAELAARFFRDRAKTDLVNHSARLAWADALTFLEDFPAAVAVLDEGLTATRDPVYRQALARVYAAWFDARQRPPGAPPGELLALLDKGLAHDPVNHDLLNRLLGQLRPAGAAADDARAVLHKILADGGPASAVVHFALAVDARLRGDAAGERLHLELAFKLDPKMPLIANNLACILSQPPDPDLPRALALANVALAGEPDSLACLDTRGRIYLALGRWQEALADLEAVLRRAPQTAGLHTALAQAYERLGQTAVAAEHRRLAVATAARPAVTP
jgi:tetratricopeptide (TPR) repeat protein